MMHRGQSLGDYEWLVSGSADAWLKLAAEQPATPNFVAQLRKSLSAERVGLVMAQVALRDRARRKFRGADRLFFDAIGLEQATDETIARYKATALGTIEQVADLCCGLGGDAMSMAQSADCVAVDCDPLRLILARANLERTSLGRFEVRHGDATTISLAEFQAWHIDPDRRPSGRRTTCTEQMQPSADQIAERLACHPHGMIKLAPASEVPREWVAQAEREWIGHSRQCHQQLVRFGRLARHPGKRSATVISPTDPESCCTLSEERMEDIPRVDRLLAYLVEPHAAIIAAGLSDQFAARQGWCGLNHGVAYFTADEPTAHPAAQCYRIVAAMPLDVRRVRRWLQDHHARIQVVKKRGVNVEPRKLLRQLSSSGEVSYTLIALPVGKGVVAAIAGGSEEVGL